MNLNNLKKLYTNSPLWMKKLYSSIPYDLRNGKEYRKWNAFLNIQIDEESYQLFKLKETLAYAYDNTSYYRKVFDELRCNIQDFKQLKDMEYIPFIDKNIVRENYEDMIAKSFPQRKTFYVTTGGSSGEPMKFLQSKNVWSKEVAFINHYFQQYNYSPNQKKASFRGGDFDSICKNEYWKYNPINNEIHFSPFHIGAETIHYYVEKLNFEKIEFFHAYPSAIIALIKHMKNSDLSLNYKLKTIFLISENITAEELRYIENYFHCEVSSFYGHSERVIFASFDSSSVDTYRINRRYGFTELIENKEKKMELVGTSFDNFAMPLIRYRTDDFTTYNNKDMGLLNLVSGRWDKEFLNGTNGLDLTLTALNMHSDIFKNVMNLQFLQKEIGKVELLIVPNKVYSDNDSIAILTALNKKANHAIIFKIKIIASPILTKRGKLKKLIKEIPIKNFLSILLIVIYPFQLESNDKVDSIVGNLPVSVTPVSRGTIFISPTGSGSRCTQKEPCNINGLDNSKQSIPIKAGDVVFFREGIYFYNMERLRRIYLKGGEKGNPVIYESYPGEKAIFDGSRLKVTIKDKEKKEWREGRIQLRENYTIFRKIEIRNMPQYGLRIFGNHNIVEGCIVHDNHLSGIEILNHKDGYSTRSTGGSFNIVQNNIIYNNSDEFLSYGNYNLGGNADGITIHSGVDNKLLHNRIYQNSDDGIDTYKSMNSQVSYNLIYANGKGKEGNANGIKVGSSNRKLGLNPMVTHNIIYGNNGFGITVHGKDNNATLLYNTAYENQKAGYAILDDTVINYNIAYKNKQGAMVWSQGKEQKNNSWQLTDFLFNFKSLDSESTDFLRLQGKYLSALGCYAFKEKK